MEVDSGGFIASSLVVVRLLFPRKDNKRTTTRFRVASTIRPTAEKRCPHRFVQKDLRGPLSTSTSFLHLIYTYTFPLHLQVKEP